MTSTRPISVPDGRQRQADDRQILGRDVLQQPDRLAEEMMMIGDVGVEIGAARLDHDLAQQPGRR